MRASGSIAASRSACAASSPRMSGYADTVTQVGVRISLQQTALARIADHRQRDEGRDA